MSGLFENSIFFIFLVSENVEAPFHARRRYSENPYFLGRDRTRRSKCIEDQGYIRPEQNRSESESGQRIYLSNGTDRAGLAKWRRSITEGLNCQGTLIYLKFKGFQQTSQNSTRKNNSAPYWKSKSILFFSLKDFFCGSNFEKSEFHTSAYFRSHQWWICWILAS